MCYTRTYTHTHTLQAAANVQGLRYIEVSAKSGDNVDTMFNIVVDGILQLKSSMQSEVEDVKIRLTSEQVNDVDMRSGCCGQC